jgi:prepilin-type N-terminal cleavage/methylation domain-containing protein
MPRKGFTLIELLVVIAIIALLLSIVMPSLSKAKMYAQETVCKSNLRQYSIATEMYCNENGDVLPDPWYSFYDSCQGRCSGLCTDLSHQSFPGETQRYCRWHNPDYNLESHPEYAGPYWEYLAVTQANVCPTFSRLAPKYGSSHWSACIGEPFVPQFSYSMNAIFRKVVGTRRLPVKKTQVRSPSQTFLWAEENMWTLTSPSLASPSLSTCVLNDNALLVTTGGSDCFASFHKISAAKLSIQRSESRYESNSGVSNILLVDGAVTWASPEQSLDYRGEIR